MLIHRRLNVPPLPASLHELKDTIISFEPVTGFYRGHCYETDGSIALLFMHDDMIEPLSSSKALYADGTFDVSILFSII